MLAGAGGKHLHCSVGLCSGLDDPSRGWSDHWVGKIEGTRGTRGTGVEMTQDTLRQTTGG